MVKLWWRRRYAWLMGFELAAISLMAMDACEWMAYEAQRRSDWYWLKPVVAPLVWLGLRLASERRPRLTICSAALVGVTWWQFGLQLTVRGWGLGQVAEMMAQFQWIPVLNILLALLELSLPALARPLSLQAARSSAR
jgi:hypothetical protein